MSEAGSGSEMERQILAPGPHTMTSPVSLPNPQTPPAPSPLENPSDFGVFVSAPPSSDFRVVKNLAHNVWLCLPRDLKPPGKLPPKQDQRMNTRLQEKLKKAQSLRGPRPIKELWPKLIVVKMFLSRETCERQIAIRRHLHQRLSIVQDPSPEERLLLEQVTTTPSGQGTYPIDPNGEWLAMNPIRGIPLTHLLRDLPDNGLPATLIYALLLRLLDTLATLHKHSVMHNDITADKVLINIPEAPSNLSTSSVWPLAKHLVIRLLLSSKSQIIKDEKDKEEGEGGITNQHSKTDTTALVTLIHSLTQKHAFFLHNAALSSLFPPLHEINNPAINPSGPPYIAQLADDLNRMITYPSSLDNARGYFRDRMRLALDTGGKVKANDLRSTQRLRREVGEEGGLPGWIACLGIGVGGVEEAEVKRAAEEEIKE